VQSFLLDLCRLNNNSQNKFLDDTYKMVYLEALGRSVSRTGDSVRVVEKTFLDSIHLKTKVDFLLLFFCVPRGPNPKLHFQHIAQELVHALNLERIRPSYNMNVTQGCLRGLMHLRKVRCLHESVTVDEFLMDNLTLWWKFAQDECHTPVK